MLAVSQHQNNTQHLLAAMQISGRRGWASVASAALLAAPFHNEHRSANLLKHHKLRNSDFRPSQAGGTLQGLCKVLGRQKQSQRRTLHMDADVVENYVLAELVDRATDKRRLDIDADVLAQLKALCRRNDDNAAAAADLLLDRLKANDAQVRSVCTAKIIHRSLLL